MESQEQEEVRQNFMMLTGCSRNITDQYLQAAEWNMETAKKLFYGNVPITKQHPLPPVVPPPVSRHQRSIRERLYKGSKAFASSVTAFLAIVGGVVRPTVSDHRPQFATEELIRSKMENELRLSDSQQENNSLPSSSVKRPKRLTDIDIVNATKNIGRNPAESGQSLYVGGSESSGQIVIDPSTGRPQHYAISRVFDAARQQGGREIASNDRKVKRVSRKLEKPVSDTNNPLGSFTTSEISKTNNQIPAKSHEASSTLAEIVPIRFYSDGFTVGENGLLRQINENQEFLAYIKRGEVPPELKRGEINGCKIEISLEDHRQEQYRPSEYIFKPFEGTGKVLGLPGSKVDKNAPVARSSVSSRIPESIDIPRLEKIAERYLKTSSKATIIRLRLPDISTPLTIHIDLNRSLMDIRQMIIDHIPELRSNAFEFLEPPSTKIRPEDERHPLSNTAFGHSTLAVHRINK